MTIHITKPEVEALINQRLESGAFRDAEDMWRFRGGCCVSAGNPYCWGTHLHALSGPEAPS